MTGTVGSGRPTLSDADVTAAIQGDRLADLAARVLAGEPPGSAAHEQATAILATCRSIGSAVAAEHDRIVALLRSDGIGAGERPPPETAQRHVITVEITEPDVDRAVDLLERDGYARQHVWSRGAARSFRRTSSEIALSRSTELTTLVKLRWRPPRPRTRWARLTRPTPADWAAFELPVGWWRAYPLVRLGRLALERVGLRSADHASLEPYLVTPLDLLDPVLELGGITAADVVLDFGCGDGRFLIRAVERHGCRAMGVEQSSELAAVAAASVRRHGLSDEIRVSCGDALQLDLRDVTLVVLFLPLVVARRVVPLLHDRLSPGARIVLHEQSTLPTDMPPPQRSRPIITAGAITVAHRWDVSGRA
jgi:SAM-dependent methyltransferase